MVYQKKGRRIYCILQNKEILKLEDELLLINLKYTVIFDNKRKLAQIRKDFVEIKTRNKIDIFSKKKVTSDFLDGIPLIIS